MDKTEQAAKVIKDQGSDAVAFAKGYLDAGIGCRRDRRYIGSDYYRRGYLAGAMDSDVVNLDNN